MCPISSADAEFFGAVLGSAVPQDPVLCIPVTPTFGCAESWDRLASWCVWQGGTFVALWTSASCRWEGRDREYLTAPWMLSTPSGPSSMLFAIISNVTKIFSCIKALCIYLLTSLEHINRSENILLVIKDYYKYVLF